MPVLFPSSFHRLSRLNHFSVSTPSQKPTLTTATTTTTGASIGGGDVVGDKSVVNIPFRYSRLPSRPRQNYSVESHVWSLAASPHSDTPRFMIALTNDADLLWIYRDDQRMVVLLPRYAYSQGPLSFVVLT